MAETINHSAAPWRVEPLAASHGDDTVVMSADGLQVCRIPGKVWDERAHLRFPEDRDNFALIAMAPRLLKELRRAERFIAGFEECELQYGVGEMLADIRGALREIEVRIATRQLCGPLLERAE